MYFGDFGTGRQKLFFRRNVATTTLRYGRVPTESVFLCSARHVQSAVPSPRFRFKVCSPGRASGGGEEVSEEVNIIRRGGVGREVVPGKRK